MQCINFFSKFFIYFYFQQQWWETIKFVKLKNDNYDYYNDNVNGIGIDRGSDNDNDFEIGKNGVIIKNENKFVNINIDGKKYGRNFEGNQICNNNLIENFSDKRNFKDNNNNEDEEEDKEMNNLMNGYREKLYSFVKKYDSSVDEEGLQILGDQNEDISMYNDEIKKEFRLPVISFLNGCLIQFFDYYNFNKNNYVKLFLNAGNYLLLINYSLL